jgi:hypothetical protein
MVCQEITVDYQKAGYLTSTKLNKNLPSPGEKFEKAVM